MANENLNTGVVMRQDIRDYISEPDAENYEYLAKGVVSLDENPNAKTDQTTYICDATATTDVISYETQFPFEAHMMTKQPAIMMLHEVARNHRTGSDAEKDYVRVDLFDKATDSEGTEIENTFKARKFRVSVEVTSYSGGGGEKISLSGNLNAKGDPIDGTFNTVTKKFTATE